MRLSNDFGPQSNITQPRRKLKEEKIKFHFNFYPILIRFKGRFFRDRIQIHFFRFDPDLSKG